MLEERENLENFSSLRIYKYKRSIYSLHEENKKQVKETDRTIEQKKKEKKSKKFRISYELKHKNWRVKLVIEETKKKSKRRKKRNSRYSRFVTIAYRTPRIIVEVVARDTRNQISILSKRLSILRQRGTIKSNFIPFDLHEKFPRSISTTMKGDESLSKNELIL